MALGFVELTASAGAQAVCTAFEAEANINSCEALGDQDETGVGIFEAVTMAVNESLVHVESIDRGTSTGGTFVITVDGEDSGAIAFDAAAATVETAVEAITGVTAVDVTGTGTVADPWVVTFVDVGPKVISVDGASLTGGDATATTSTTTLGVDGVAAADTAITYDTLVGELDIRKRKFAVIDSEVVEIVSFTSTVLTVLRGQQGTVAADHADDSVITVAAEVLPQPNKVIFRVDGVAAADITAAIAAVGGCRYAPGYPAATGQPQA